MEVGKGVAWALSNVKGRALQLHRAIYEAQHGIARPAGQSVLHNVRMT